MRANFRKVSVSDEALIMKGYTKTNTELLSHKVVSIKGEHVLWHFARRFKTCIRLAVQVGVTRRDKECIRHLTLELQFKAFHLETLDFKLFGVIIRACRNRLVILEDGR